MDHKSPKVGVGVIVLHDGKVLLGKRRGSHGADTWSLPGGHLEFGESVESCATREVLEETGLAIEVLSLGPYTSDVFEAEEKHYVTLFVVASSSSGAPELREPEKCSCWDWFNWSNLPRPLFLPLESLLKTGFIPEGTR